MTDRRAVGAPSLETLKAVALYREAKADPKRQARFRALEAERRAIVASAEPRYQMMMGPYRMTVTTRP